MDTACLRIVCADTAALMEKLLAKGIEICDVSAIDELTIEIRCACKDIGLITHISNAFGGEVKIQRFNGLKRFFKKIKQRKVLIFGAILLLCILAILPSRVLFIAVDGNHAIPTNLVLEKAEACGIRFGASRRYIRSESVKNALLREIPQLQWVGINTSGCVATILVKEKGEGETQTEQFETGNIVAVNDGVIYDFTVTNGTAACREGDAVFAGQLLVSGYMECGSIIKSVRPEAEIMACTIHSQTVVAPNRCSHRTDVLDVEKRVSLRIGKKLINFCKDSGIYDATCVKMYSEEFITLPGGFVLPVSVVVEQIVSYETNAATQQVPNSSLIDYSDTYLLGQLQAGKILDRKQSISRQDGIVVLEAKYICTEMIGQFVKEELLNKDGQTE